jgi:hypothetical protein
VVETPLLLCIEGQKCALCVLRERILISLPFYKANALIH